MTDYWISAPGEVGERIRNLWLFKHTIKELVPIAIKISKIEPNTPIYIETGGLIPGTVMIPITKKKFLNGVEVPYQPTKTATYKGVTYYLKGNEWYTKEEIERMKKKTAHPFGL